MYGRWSRVSQVSQDPCGVANLNNFVDSDVQGYPQLSKFLALNWLRKVYSPACERPTWGIFSYWRRGTGWLLVRIIKIGARQHLKKKKKTSLFSHAFEEVWSLSQRSTVVSVLFLLDFSIPLLRMRCVSYVWKNEHKQWPPGQLEIFLGNMSFLQFSVQSLSCVQLFVTPWTAACQVSLSVTNSWSLLKLMSVESVMPTNHLILCHPLLCLPAIFPSIRVFSHESVLCIRWPEYWSFSISPSNE